MDVRIALRTDGFSPEPLSLFEPGTDGMRAGMAARSPGRPTRAGHATVDYAPYRDILTRATGFMDAYDYTLNPYAGCSFGCTYCYAAFFSRSKAERDGWGYWVKVKENAVERLKRRRLSLDGKLIYMSSVTDPYQPIERRLRLTRQLLQVLADRHRPRLVVQTRSPDVVRDADLYLRMSRGGSFRVRQGSLLGEEGPGRSDPGGVGDVQVNLTVTTDDEDVRRTFEPHCPSNEQRLGAARELRSRGVRTCITLTPLLWVNDPESFAKRLLATGVSSFIMQPFHLQRGKFVAGTRDSALGLMADKLGTSPGDFRAAYERHYRAVREVLMRHLPAPGEGKDGFRPPF